MNDNNAQQPVETATDESGPSIRVAAQFIRDLSFECPNVHRLLEGPGDNPNLQLQVNVSAKGTESGLFESVIDLSANASNAAGVIYELEVSYGGLFQIRNLPREAVEQLLMVNGPALLFPFLRRLVADVTREGGFPPLFLDPIDFAGLYLRRKQEGEGQAPATA
ncbi:MAG: protein-export chaperone SecB [Hyphomicrobiaceae bacterium]|nr:protein-export chaperone SecB [Hyphomicrobiaceae bacterium]